MVVGGNSTAAPMRGTRGLAGGSARVQLGMLALAGWYRGHRVHLQRIRFVWSRGANAFDSRSATAEACVVRGGKHM